MHTPGRPVTCAYPVAACPAPCSWRTRMCRTEGESKSGSYSGRMAPPGMPNTTSTPSCSSARDQGRGPRHAGTGRGGGFAARCGVAVGRIMTRARVGAGPFAGRGGALLGRAGTGRAGVGFRRIA